ncbi:ACH96158.1 unknown protein [Kallithea virus]|uniref:Uncharacterized protein n=1 Tax=Kallithea virus TaxID=1654582 RepID=A0A0F7KNJ4_9VIRU|nr:ACH96158.1 unknown protein [Kallithea virus]AKH40352.1 hypothetical protein [Kallithea virus]AQN78578.1 ACH96158.1 unknown protein [Kallithea virus]
MDYSDHLIAEQSVYAYLNVDRQEPQQSRFQESVSQFYKYSKNNATQLTNVDPNGFSITNLPDTVAFLPQNSIFNNIMMIRKEDPDFRFVPVSETRDIFERNSVPIIVSDATVTMFTPKVAAPRQNMFTRAFPTDTSLNSARVTNPNNLVYDDPKFVNFTNVSSLSGYNDLVTRILAIINAPPESTINDRWASELYGYYGYDPSEIRSVLNNENQHKNRMTITIRIIDSLNNRQKTNANSDEQFVAIKNEIDAYVARL